MLRLMITNIDHKEYPYSDGTISSKQYLSVARYPTDLNVNSLTTLEL